MNNLEDIPQLDFTPEGRKFELALIKEYKKGIMESKELSKESKKIQILLWNDYLKSYEEFYQEYQRGKIILSN